jgi:hypothetical protein
LENRKITFPDESVRVAVQIPVMLRAVSKGRVVGGGRRVEEEEEEEEWAAAEEEEEEEEEEDVDDEYL